MANLSKTTANQLEVLAHATPEVAPEVLEPTDALTAYMRSARRYPLLTAEEERELGLAKMSGDNRARERLICSNLRLVAKMAHEYRVVCTGDRMDLIQEGNAGLIKAVERFNPDGGAKLSTYAAWWIKAYIWSYLMRTFRMVRLGTTNDQRKLFYGLNKCKLKLEEQGLDVTPENVAKALDVDPEVAKEMDLRMGQQDVILSTPANREEDGRETVGDMLADANPTPDALVEAVDMRRRLQEAFTNFAATLEGRDAEVYHKRLMPTGEPVTLRELGELWGVVRERARQIEARLKGRMREYLTTELGPDVALALAA